MCVLKTYQTNTRRTLHMAAVEAAAPVEEERLELLGVADGEEQAPRGRILV
jgi:hypothetical protein